MMNVSRRRFLGTASAATILGPALARCATAAKEGAPNLRVGVCDWSYGGRGTPDALEQARAIGLEGVEISPRKPDDVLSYSAPEMQAAYRKKEKETGLAVASVAMTITNQCPLATDARGPAWLTQSIDTAHALNAGVILMAFFGKGALKAKEGMKPDCVDALVERLKVAAPYAKKKGVVLGLENTLSAQENVRIMEAIGHESVQVYYDIANSTRNGYDVPTEIRMLGNRICQFHFKDNKGEFNSGNPEMPPIIRAVKEINYRGWLILERGFGKDKAAYFKHQGEYVRKAFGLG